MKKVIVGMSGGVDSSVVALLLKNEGYEVIGITFKFIDDFDSTRAEEVASSLGIEHHIVDYRDIFKKEVMDTFINDYRRGITPNPCIMCNKKVKIKFLYDEMKKFDADFIATGHYAKIEDGHIYKSKCVNKDQTYFLCEVSSEMISKLILPLEGMEKEEVRKIANENNIASANDKDSTDVCFITSKFREFIKNEIKDKKGDIINVDTLEKIGEHNGVSHYTVGQRRGLNIGGMLDRTFVVGKNVDKNILYVSIGDGDALISDSCILENVNFINYPDTLKCKAVFRYHSTPNDVEIKRLDEDKLLVKYPQGVKSVTPGQACALYISDELIGGGIIKEVYKNDEKMWYL